MKGRRAKRILRVGDSRQSAKAVVCLEGTFRGSRNGNIKVEENGQEKSKNIGIVFPSGKKVKLTNLPFRTETVYLETRNKFPLTIWQELNELHAQYISQLATYKLEEVRNFIQSKGKGKLVAYRMENLTKEEKEQC